MEATIHYASVMPSGHGAYNATVELVINDEVVVFKKRVTDMEMIDQYVQNKPLPLVNYVTNYNYEIKR